MHVFNPTAALDLVWQRLEECYGSSEAVEHALLKKVEDFPKLTNKDNVRLRELGDILQEIECAKVGGYLPGLSYLDTARGVNPIVEKLPYSLQGKWVATGSKYKDYNGVAFPPFCFFSSFVRQQVRVKKDPSFAFTSSSTQGLKIEKYTRSGNRASVTVHKTDVPQDSMTIQCSSGEKIMESPDKLCPIHKKPHPLKKCRSFRAKHIDERKSFLKENRICFRCCGSVQHMAKDCRVTLKCLECNSEKHVSALHPGPPPTTTGSQEAYKDDCGEVSVNVLTPVTSKCTEICGNSDGQHSCSKISQVIVYPAGKREEGKKMYVVLDEQSNKSLAKSEFFHLFNICLGTTHKPASVNVLKTRAQ